MGQKKQRLAEAEGQQNPPDTAQTSSPKEPRLGTLSTLGLQRSIYFSSPKDHPVRLGPEFFDQPAVPLARAFLGQVMLVVRWPLLKSSSLCRCHGPKHHKFTSLSWSWLALLVFTQGVALPHRSLGNLVSVIWDHWKEDH
jgi:hypothetical protein